MPTFFLLAIAALLALVAPVAPVAHADDKAQPVQPFDLTSYTGVWYEIARYENFFQKNLDGVTATYTLQPNGTIKVTNRGYTPNNKLKESTAKTRDAGASDDGFFQVQFTWPFWTDYRVIALDPDYHVALVTSGSKDYFWLLSRTPTLPPEALETWLQRAEALGFPRNQMRFTDQSRFANQP